jgi:hypothetical protein
MQPPHGFWKTAQVHTTHTTDIQLLLANQVLLTPSAAEELAQQCHCHRACTLTHSLSVCIHAHK